VSALRTRRDSLGDPKETPSTAFLLLKLIGLHKFLVLSEKVTEKFLELLQSKRLTVFGSPMISSHCDVDLGYESRYQRYFTIVDERKLKEFTTLNHQIINTVNKLITIPCRGDGIIP